MKLPPLKTVSLALVFMLVFGSFSSDPTHAAECQSMAAYSYKVIKKVDKTHYLLIANGSDGLPDSPHLLMETHRALSGNDVHFDKATSLGMSGPRIIKSSKDMSKIVFKWREGCSKEIKEKDQAKHESMVDPNSGIWWIGLAPDLTYCTNPVTAKTNVAPATMLKISGCAVDTSNNLDGVLVIDCERSVAAMKMYYFRSRSFCKKFMALVNATGTAKSP